MTTFFYKGLIRNPEIGNTHVWVFPNIWRVGWVMNTKSGTNVSDRMLLNAAKFHGYSFYRFWVIKGKPTGGGGLKLLPLPQPKLGLKCSHKEISIGNQTVEMIEILSSCHFFYLWYQKGLEESKKGSDVVKISLNLWWVSHRLILIA